MKRHSIHWKLIVVALAPAALIAALLSAYFVYTRIAESEASLNDRGLAIARQLAPAAEYGVFSGNREILQRLTEAALREHDVQWVAISDANGAILAASGRGPRLGLLAGYAVGLDAAVARNESVLAFSAPIHLAQLSVEDEWNRGAPSARRVIGRVNVELSRTSTERHKNELLATGFAISAGGLVLGLLLALYVSRQVSTPLLRLARAVDDIGQGKLDLRVPEDSRGELGVLERGVNQMAAALEASHDHLQQRILDATSRLSYQASHDALTGLPNRREFEARLERALDAVRRGQQRHVLCYLDLDQFKVVNDTCGHVAGDELLRQLSTLLASRLRERDTLARLGGDEFGVLLENCDIEAAQVIAEVLRQTVKDFRFVWQERVFGIGVSIGMVELHADSGDRSQLLAAADSACYAAKERGRNRVHVWHEDDAELNRRRGEMQWFNRITAAIEENRLRLYVQPIYPATAESGLGVHYEILLRMLDDRGEAVLPMAFIPAAERYNLMPTIDRWVVSSALALCSEALPLLDADCVWTVNLSGHSLGDETFLEFVERQFEVNHLPHHRVCFEITETAAVSNLREAERFIATMRAKGCTFSLDDFGSGLASFHYLKNRDVDYVKIDGGFVRDMGSDPMDRAMVEAIQRIAEIMGLKTIAESVEDEATLAMLRRVGVDYVQGEWLHPPTPLAHLIAELRAGK